MGRRLRLIKDGDPETEVSESDAAVMLRQLARSIEIGEVSVQDLFVCYTSPPVDASCSPDVGILRLPDTSVQEAYWIMGRLQQRLTLVENSESHP